MSKISKYSFEQVEQKLDVIKEVYEKFVVVCIAGQSNAVGYDESLVDIGSKLAYVSRDTDRIKQLGFYGADNLQIIDLGYCAQSMQDMRQENGKRESVRRGTKGLHLPLANLLLDYIPKDYGVLMLPISFGGTGFNSGNVGTYNADAMKPSETGSGEGTAILKWGRDTAYYETLMDRIKYALQLNEENLFAGIIWCQGENDMGNASTHYTAFQEMTEALFTALNDAGLGGRTPKGTWDSDIWYNMETVSYWYTQGQCQQIWDNYRAWNEDTYIEIPRNTESNVVNGTGDTAGEKAKHYGNNAYQKVIAPLVLQKLIDMDTFGKKVNVVEPEVEAQTGGSSYPVATEGTRLATNSDIVVERTIDFTIDESGNCTTDMADFQGSFFKSEDKSTNDNTRQPGLSFGDIYKMDWKAKRGVYWLIIEEDLNGNYLVLGLGQSSTGQLTRIHNNTLDTSTYGRISSPVYPNYQFQEGDRIRVYRNPDNSVSIYKTAQANGVFHHWFDCPAKNAYEGKLFGFVCGIAGNEFNGAFTGDKNVLFHDMKIQKQELFPNNKIVDLQIEGMLKNIADLATQ